MPFASIWKWNKSCAPSAHCLLQSCLKIRNMVTHFFMLRRKFSTSFFMPLCLKTTKIICFFSYMCIHHRDVQLMCFAVKNIYICFLCKHEKYKASYAYAYFLWLRFFYWTFSKTDCIRLTIQHVIRIDTCCYIQGRIWLAQTKPQFLPANAMQCIFASSYKVLRFSIQHTQFASSLQTKCY